MQVDRTGEGVNIMKERMQACCAGMLGAEELGCSYLCDLLVTHTSIHNIVMIIIVELLRGDGMML